MSAIPAAHAQHLLELAHRASEAVRGVGVAHLQAEVVFIVDVSIAMHPLVKTGALQELATQILALSLQFDDDGAISCWAFGDACRHAGNLRIDGFPGFVDRHVVRSAHDYQTGCRFTPVIDAVCRHYFEDAWLKPAKFVEVGRVFRQKRIVYPRLSIPRLLPVFAVWVTHGDCEDTALASEYIRRSSYLPIFWQFAGVDPDPAHPSRFRFLRRLDHLSETHVDNCGFFRARDCRDPKELFSGLLNEFPAWLQQPLVKKMLLQPV